MTDERIIELDGTGWKDVSAFLAALQAAIGAPGRHGWSPGAFVDSMIWSGVNAIDPPYTIVVTGLEHAPAEVVSHVDLISGALAEADDEHLVRTGARVNAKVVRRLS